jgi:hypothetical protein
MSIRPVLIHAVAWSTGCLIAAAVLGPARRALSPWAAIDAEQIVMLSSDGCMTSRRATELVQSDPRLAGLVIPVPIGGPDADQPLTCAAALRALEPTRPIGRWIPTRLACRWLQEDVGKVLPHEGVATPSWYVHGQLIESANESAGESALFLGKGWHIAWGPMGLQLWPVGEEAPPVTRPSIARIEDMGMSSYRSSAP